MNDRVIYRVKGETARVGWFEYRIIADVRKGERSPERKARVEQAAIAKFNSVGKPDKQVGDISVTEIGWVTLELTAD